MNRWEEVLQPALEEIQLLASPEVTDLADRVSGALLHITIEIETPSTFVDYYPGWFQARDLVQILRDAMRQELGLKALPEQPPDMKLKDNWPWLPDRPDRDSYRQVHVEDSS